MGNYLRCDHCGKFMKPEDVRTYQPPGSACYDPPEPYDPEAICAKCNGEFPPNPKEIRNETKHY